MASLDCIEDARLAGREADFCSDFCPLAVVGWLPAARPAELSAVLQGLLSCVFSSTILALLSVPL